MLTDFGCQVEGLRLRAIMLVILTSQIDYSDRSNKNIIIATIAVIVVIVL